MHKKITTAFLFILFFSLGLFSQEIVTGKWSHKISVPWTYNGRSGTAPVRSYFPKKYTKGASYRTLIALHEYKGRYYDWGIKTPIESFAEKKNFVIVCPDMGRTLYEMKFYPETTEKWADIPGGIFIGEVLISFLRETYGLARRKGETGIVGVDTGARGAITVAQNYPEKFGAAGGFSGDYDPLSMTRNKPLTKVYGPYKQHKERWKEDANLIASARKLRGVYVFIAHGGRDTMTHPLQSMMMAIKLRNLEKRDRAYSIDYFKINSGMTTWPYWRRYFKEMIPHLDKVLK